jgi:hypothetical protein
MRYHFNCNVTVHCCWRYEYANIYYFYVPGVRIFDYRRWRFFSFAYRWNLFFRESKDGVRWIEFKDKMFRIVLGENELKGSFFADDKTLNLSCFDGKLIKFQICTYAIIHGHLWLGVLRREKSPGDEKYYGNVPGPGVFDWPLGEPNLPAGSIAIDLKGKWFGYTASTGINVPIREFKESDSKEKEKGREHILEFENDPKIFKLPALLIDRRKYYKLEDIIVTPWSVDFGPCGIFPKAFNADEMMGEWKSENEELNKSAENKYQYPGRFSIIEPERSQQYNLPLRGPRPTTSIFTRIQFKPDERGIAHFHIAWDCVMNHMDFPISGVLIPFEKGRLIRFISRGGCSNEIPAQGPEVFVKVQSKQ